VATNAETDLTAYLKNYEEMYDGLQGSGTAVNDLLRRIHVRHSCGDFGLRARASTIYAESRTVAASGVTGGRALVKAGSPGTSGVTSGRNPAKRKQRDQVNMRCEHFVRSGGLGKVQHHPWAKKWRRSNQSKLAVRKGSHRPERDMDWEYLFCDQPLIGGVITPSCPHRWRRYDNVSGEDL